MNSTSKIVIQPNETFGTEALIPALLQHVVFTEFPVNLVLVPLMRARAILDVIASGNSDDVMNLADAAQAEMEVPVAVVEAWHRQSGKVQP